MTRSLCQVDGIYVFVCVCFPSPDIELHFLPCSLLPTPTPPPLLQPSLIAAMNEFRFRPDQVALGGGVRALLAEGFSVYSAHPGRAFPFSPGPTVQQSEGGCNWRCV